MNAVREFADVLIAGADASEDGRRLVPESVAALRDSGLFAALAPFEVGGFQVDPITELELIEEVSGIDASAGWSFWASAGSTARVASMLPEAALSEIFPLDDPFPVFAFQERAFGNIVRPSTEGLWVSGRWPFGTGLAHAEWVVAVGTAEPGNVAGPLPGADCLAAAIPTSQVRLVDTWNAAGLCGTGTFDYDVENVLVPWNRVWAYPPVAPLRGGRYFCFRRAAIKHSGFALGVARGSLQRFSSHLKARAAGGNAPHGAIVTDLARRTLAYEAARALALEAVTKIWQEALIAGSVSAASQGRLRAVARYVTEVAVDACSLVVRHGDASLVARQNYLQRNLRDITVASAHAEVNHGAIETYGEALVMTPADSRSWSLPSTGDANGGNS